jgi:hypothetical protein
MIGLCYDARGGMDDVCQVFPFGTGTVLSGDTIPFEAEETWVVEGTGATALEALQSVFGVERECLIDLWLYDSVRKACAMVARDWGATQVGLVDVDEDPALLLIAISGSRCIRNQHMSGVYTGSGVAHVYHLALDAQVEAVLEEPAPEGEGEGGGEGAPPPAAGAATTFSVTNQTDTCRVYSEGEIHVVIHCNVKFALVETVQPPPPPPGVERQPKVFRFRMSSIQLHTCLGVGSADKGVEEIE